MICPVCGNETDQWGYCFHHCHYCFKSLGNHEECTCGYEGKIHPPQTLREGTELANGRYVIGAVLGKGGFGITYLGFDTVTKTVVAIKEYFPDDFVTRGKLKEKNRVISHSPYYERFLEKFKNEAAIMAHFNYIPHIVRVQDWIRENNTAYIIMEYIDGISLKELLKKSGGKLDWQELIPMLDPMLGSLEVIHNEKIIHRDISPDNILFDHNGKPVLIDFGTARIGSSSGGSVPTGKIGYAPIEQVEGAESQDRRTDVYALGATYYKALTGVVPTSSKVRIAIDNIEPVKRLVPDVPDYIDHAIMKALSPNIDDRWNSVEEFRSALKGQNNPASHFTHILIDGDEPGKDDGEDPEKTDHKGTGNKGLLWTLILIGLIVLGGLIYLFFWQKYPDNITALMYEAENGDVKAMISLGYAWQSGDGVKQDDAKACGWFRKAAEQGYGPGEYALANCYHEGVGIQPDKDEYARYLEMAARSGLAAAQYDFARYYEFEGPNKPDLENAKYWYEKAADQDYGPAIDRLDNWK